MRMSWRSPSPSLAFVSSLYPPLSLSLFLYCWPGKTRSRGANGGGEADAGRARNNCENVCGRSRGIDPGNGGMRLSFWEIAEGDAVDDGGGGAARTKKRERGREPIRLKSARRAGHRACEKTGRGYCVIDIEL